MPLRAQLAALVLAVASSLASAADVVGYSEAFDTLYRVDITTRTATEIGRATPPGVLRHLVDGLTFSPGGVLFAVWDAGAVKTLLRINSGNGLATPVGTLDLGTSQEADIGLAFTADGKLWLSNRTGNLWQVDPNNAATTLVGNLGVTITGLTSRGNTLYAAGSQGNNNLYQIDPVAVHANLIGEYGTSINYVTAASPAFDASGQLWVILDYVPPPSDANPQAAKWSDLAQTVAAGRGTLANLGPITAPDNTQSAADLEFIGLRGLAITPPTAPAGTPVGQAPVLSLAGMAALLLMLVTAAGTWLRRNRPNC